MFRVGSRGSPLSRCRHWPSDSTGTRCQTEFQRSYSALQTKIIDGQENPLSLIEFHKFYQVQKYVS